MQTRRLLLAGLAALSPGAALAARPAIYEKAIARAGGRAALERGRVLAWTGHARIFAGERVIEIGVDTEVEPFRYARSNTWLEKDGPSKQRSLLIEGETGWMISAAGRAPMPPAMLRHEREQYALYGLMRLVSLRDPGARFVETSTPGGGVRGLKVNHPGAPETDLWFEPDGRLAWASNTVDNPEEGGAPIAQVFTFSGVIEGGGVRWPRTIAIEQNGKPYFELTLASFTPRAKR